MMKLKKKRTKKLKAIELTRDPGHKTMITP